MTEKFYLAVTRNPDVAVGVVVRRVWKKQVTLRWFAPAGREVGKTEAAEFDYYRIYSFFAIRNFNHKIPIIPGDRILDPECE